MNSTLVMLLAGGVGSRLNILGAARAKPAVPFGGRHRIIDFTLSNAMNSGLNIIGVLTQYKPLSLMDHIGNGEPWDLLGRTRGAKILPPRTGQQDSDWYKGTADAVRQNMDFIRSNKADRVMILSGDHIYKMDYAEMIGFHKKNEADLTIGMMPVPWEETNQFGIANVDQEGRIIDWEEKPEKAKSNLASMGIYVFETEYLLDALQSQPEHDFGKNIIPSAIENDNVFCYPFEGYWRDVGTIKAYWEANMDLLQVDSGLDLDAWRIRTRVEEVGRLGDRPPAFIAPGGSVKNSILSPGCVIKGTVEDSVLSPGVVIQEGATLSKSVVMHDSIIGKNANVSQSIIDKNVITSENATLGNGDPNKANIEKPSHLWSGLIVVGKRAVIPANAVIGKNSIIGYYTSEADYHSLQIPEGSTIKNSRA